MEFFNQWRPLRAFVCFVFLSRAIDETDSPSDVAALASTCTSCICFRGRVCLLGDYVAVRQSLGEPRLLPFSHLLGILSYLFSAVFRLPDQDQQQSSAKTTHLAHAELELELIQPHMAQKPVLRGEVGCACVAREVSVEREGMGERGCVGNTRILCKDVKCLTAVGEPQVQLSWLGF